MPQWDPEGAIAAAKARVPPLVRDAFDLYKPRDAAIPNDLLCMMAIDAGSRLVADDDCQLVAITHTYSEVESPFQESQIVETRAFGKALITDNSLQSFVLFPLISFFVVFACPARTL